MDRLPRFLTIGHITNDLGRPDIGQPDLLGGGVSYSGVAAQRLGHDVHLITKCPADHRYIAELRNLGLTVHALPSKLDANGKRSQQVPQLQEPIAIADMELIPRHLLSNSIVLLASVIGEVDLALLAELKEAKLIAVTPQGYFRGLTPDGTVVPKPWEGFERSISMAQVVVLSEEDIALAVWLAGR